MDKLLRELLDKNKKAEKKSFEEVEKTVEETKVLFRENHFHFRFVNDVIKGGVKK